MHKPLLFLLLLSFYLNSRIILSMKKDGDKQVHIKIKHSPATECLVKYLTIEILDKDSDEKFEQLFHTIISKPIEPKFYPELHMMRQNLSVHFSCTYD